MAMTSKDVESNLAMVRNNYVRITSRIHFLENEIVTAACTREDSFEQKDELVVLKENQKKLEGMIEFLKAAVIFHKNEEEG